MKLSLVLALGVCYAWPAASQAATWQEHEADARGFLSPCPMAGKKPDTACVDGQKTFIYTYVWAMAHDAIAISVMPQAFDPQKSADERRLFNNVVPPDSIQACAWAYFIYNVTDRDPKVKPAFVRHCHPLDRTDFQQAGARMKEIASSMDGEAKPPANWKPRIQGLRT